PLGDAVDRGVVRVLGGAAVEHDLHDARARSVRERGAEVVEEDLELGHAPGPSEGERREQLASGEGLEGGDRGAVRRDRLAARADDLADADADRVLDPDSIGGTLIAKERHVTIEIAGRGGAGAAR